MKRTMRRSAVGLAAAVVALAAAAQGAQELVLAERGKPAACAIVVAKDAGPSVKYAAEELQFYVRKLTGVELAVADAQERVPPPGAIAAATIRLEQTDDYGTDGFRLTARPPDLVIRGGVRGCLYGVYELLETYGGVGWYASWRTVVPKLDRLAVPADLDDEQRPAFKMRMTSWLDATHGDFAARLRLNGQAGGEARRRGVPFRQAHGQLPHVQLPAAGEKIFRGASRVLRDARREARAAREVRALGL